mmetsp:Transcript_13803/g.17364  ORF Transcript_13803/g.17364 Transcript_13803/m.17364 type:complete len:225 (-) Transcript_13803:42-716(-)|eukprot:CAMPEP_0172496074 /NCGR_PEP_ID=MMETSP1066-20121228/81245_1 /TAXON_ID=671091 /ORGANISM="Coscinodiscus wailesii, Strain CCMP2513" /LENGTH=224 /DNA_ID=CAMNT_0013268169 /DNA_START=32 /DNA_END=706 /DNA_ORIENTATION=+
MTIKISNQHMALFRCSERRGPLHLRLEKHDNYYLLSSLDESAATVSVSNDKTECELQYEDVISNREFRSLSPTCASEFCTEPRVKVRFANPIVSEVRTRPRTPISEISTLFYSSSETDQFRKDYYWSLQFGDHECDMNNEHHEREDAFESELTSSGEDSEQESAVNVRKYGLISKVTVSYDGSENSFFQDGSTTILHDDCENSTRQGQSFDSDAFWNGSITWWY